MKVTTQKTTHKTYFNWSSGKDASLAFYYLQKSGQYQIDKLLTSINEHHDRVSMHGLRRAMLLQQVQSIGLPLQTVELPKEPSMALYDERMRESVDKLRLEGYTHCGFGDIFLEDLRTYRENQLKPLGIQPCFPLWQQDTRQIILDFIRLGFKAIVICIKAELLDASFVGRQIDASFLEDLPANVDPCGENGEFHTFCFDGPIFKKAVKFSLGEKIYREYSAPKSEANESKKSLGFWFLDLLPGGSHTAA
ncbi:MAG: ATP-binding protein [Bacteroidota bacterium]